MQKIYDGKKTPRLGTPKNPVRLQVPTEERQREVATLCERHGWHADIQVAGDLPEDIGGLERLMNPPQTVVATGKVGRNAPCPCGSGKKHKKCCGP